MKKRFEFLEDVTSDVMFKAYGKNLEELLKNAGLAMFTVMCDIEKIKAKKFVEVKVEGENEEELFYNWLSELLTVHEIESMFFSDFEIKVERRENGYVVRAKAFGEDIKPENVLTVVKAVTYHKFSVKRENDSWVATVVLDI